MNNHDPDQGPIEQSESDLNTWPPPIEVEQGTSSTRKSRENPIAFIVGFVFYPIILYALICIDHAVIDFLWKRSGTQPPIQIGFNLTSVWLFVSVFVYFRHRRHNTEAAFGMIFGMVLALVLHVLDGFYNSVVSNLGI